MCMSTGRSRYGLGNAVLGFAAVLLAGPFLADARTAYGEDAAARPPGEDVKGYITFAINTHDWMHVDQSADVLLRLVELSTRLQVFEQNRKT